MFHLYNLNRDEYLAHYHKRSNVESTFSMIKAKFGDQLRSKTDTAMANEALCKVLCHNICCLIQSTTNSGSRRLEMAGCRRSDLRTVWGMSRTKKSLPSSQPAIIL